jgi:hypothetical protein
LAAELPPVHRFFLVLFALAIFGARVLYGESRENYLPNPGFEEGSKYWELVPCPNGDIKIDDAVFRSGKRSLRMEYHREVDPRLGTVLYVDQWLPAVLKEGHDYTFSGWIKIAGVPRGKSGPSAYLCEAHADRGSTPAVSGNTDPAKNNGWVFVWFRYKFPKDANGHQFRCHVQAPPDGMAGTVWFDDLKVEEGEEPTAFRPDWIDRTDLYTREAQIPWQILPLDYRSRLDFVTPHLDLARPFAGGAPRVLWAGFINNARVGCELAQRGDLTLDSVVLNASSVDATPVRMLHEKCVEVFRARLGVEPKLPADKRPQVLVIEQGTLELLNRQDRAAILDCIGQGMGCVVLLGPIRVRDHPGAVPTPKIKQLMSAAEKLPRPVSGSPGHGRVITAMNVEQHPLWGRGAAGIEAVYSDMLQAIYRSMGHGAPGPADVRASLRPRQPVAGMPWTADVYGRGAVARLSVFADAPIASCSLMDGYGASQPRTLIAQAETAANPAAPATARCAMRPLPPGEYMLLGQMLDGRRQATGWSLVPFSVTSPVEIAGLDAGAAAFVPKQPLRVACTVTNSYHPLPHARLVAQLEDPRGRVLYRSSAPTSIARGETRCDLVLDLAHAESCAVRLQVAVVADDFVQARQSVWLSAEQLMPPVDFHVGPYDDFYYGWSLLGADMVVGPPRPELGLRPLPWLDLPAALGTDGDYCDPRSQDTAVRYVTPFLSAAAPWNIVGCILHDELNGAGFSSPPKRSDVEFFRRCLRETYKDIKAVNTSWSTNFSDWGEIDDSPARFRFVTQGDRPAAPWADWHAASEQAAHRFYAALDERVRAAFPRARMGPSGTRNSNGVNGFDWWLLAHDFRYVCLYYGVHDEFYRSFAPAGRMMMNWSHLTDAETDPDGCRIRLWQDVFAQCGGTPVYGGRYSNVFFPDYRPKPGLLAYAEELAQVRAGYGRLVMAARRNDAAAAIFYSPACYRARIVAIKDDVYYNAAGEQNALLASISAALADLRIGSHFVSYEQVARGELDPRTTPCLFLWGALALSDAETAAIRRYLDGGGAVIADSEPGLYDEHCHLRASGALHDCLPPQGAVARQVGMGKFILYRDLGPGYVKARGYTYDGAAEPTSAKEALRVSDKLRIMLTEQAGLQASFRLCDDRGRDFDCAMTAMDYVDGRARYVACVPAGTYGRTLKARLTVPAAGHLYKCRTGKYLGSIGKTATSDVNLYEATGNIFALLPYRVQRLDVTAPARATLGRPIDVRAAVVAGGGPYVRHVVVLQLRRPDGRELPENRWVVETVNGSAEPRLYLALNDPAGKWTLMARDVATGIRHATEIEVQPEGPSAPKR